MIDAINPKWGGLDPAHAIDEANAAFKGGGGSSGIVITDGTHTVNGATHLAVTGGTVGGTTPNATLTISGGGGGGDLPVYTAPAGTAVSITAGSNSSGNGAGVNLYGGASTGGDGNGGGFFFYTGHGYGNDSYHWR